MGRIDFSHGGNIHAIEKRRGKKILDFSANINPLGLPAAIKKTIFCNWDMVRHYPDPNAVRLTRRIARHWGISEKNILAGNGSADLIYLIANTFRPRSVLIPAPTFSEYERAAKSVGAKIRFLKLDTDDNFTLKTMPGKADMLFLCYPNNPTGNFIVNGNEAIRRLASRLIVIDEAFMDFVQDEERRTFIRKAAKSRKLIVLRTFTKMFAMPGLRAGYIVAHESIINRLRQHQPPWNINSLAQLAAETVIGNKAYIELTRRVVARERKFLVTKLNEIKGLKIYPSLANFILIKIKRPGIDAKLLKSKMLRKNILIRDCGNFRNLNDRFVRIAVRSRAENLELLAALRQVM